MVAAHISKMQAYQGRKVPDRDKGNPHNAGKEMPRKGYFINGQNKSKATEEEPGQNMKLWVISQRKRGHTSSTSHNLECKDEIAYHGLKVLFVRNLISVPLMRCGLPTSTLRHLDPNLGLKVKNPPLSRPPPVIQAGYLL
jgi:hypothetical protein